VRFAGRIVPAAVEFTGMVLVVAGLARVVTILLYQGYLPAPFVFDSGDTFMDWFNTAYWAHNPGAYSVWRTVYLPLSFVITGLAGNPACYKNTPFDARDCDVIGIAVIILTYAACCVVAALAFRKADRATAIPRTVAMAIGGPMLFALERGNLIMLAFIPFVLAYGKLLRSRAGFAAASAFLANMKIYLVLPFFALMVRREWRLFEICCLASVGLYVVTLLIVGGGTPLEFISNLQNWFGVRQGVFWDELIYTTTYSPFLQFDVSQFPVRDFIEARVVDAAKLFIQTELVASRGVALLCVALAWFYPRAIATNRLVFFILMQSFIAQNPGGYAITLIVFLVFMEKWKNFGTGLAVICAYLISIPGDMAVTTLFELERQSWLTGRMVNLAYVLPLGSFIRPGLILIILWSLAIDTLIDVHRAVKAGPPILGLVPRFRRTEGQAAGGALR
jgi:hypothetical protein